MPMPRDLTRTYPPVPRRLTHGALPAIRIALALVFLGAGLAKLAGVPVMADLVHSARVGEGFRRGIGAAQVAGGLLLLLRRSSIPGAVLLLVVMLVVAFAQVAAQGDAVLPALGMMYLCLAIIFGR